MRAARETGSFSYRNATIIEHEGQWPAVSSVTLYLKLWIPVPADMTAMFVPLGPWR